jgi:hypothetical protein
MRSVVTAQATREKEVGIVPALARYEASGGKEQSAMSDANISHLTVRLEALEAHEAIRGVIADYVHMCDSLDQFTPMNELGELFTQNAIWVGAGAKYSTAFGDQRGRAAILAMLHTYRSPPHFHFNAHFLTSEKIVVDGRSAHGRWLMLQTSTYATGTSDLRAAKLSVDFERDTERWRISRFATENLFSRAVNHWSDSIPISVPAGALK